MNWILGLLEICISIGVIKGMFDSFGKKKSKDDRAGNAVVYFFAGLLIIGLAYWGYSSNTEIPRRLNPIAIMADAYREKHPEETPSSPPLYKNRRFNDFHKNDEHHKKADNFSIHFLIALLGGGLSFLYSLYSLIRYLTTKEENNVEENSSTENVAQNNTTPPVNTPTQPNNGGSFYNGGHNATANNQPQQKVQTPQQPPQRKPQGGKGQFNGNLYN